MSQSGFLDAFAQAPVAMALIEARESFRVLAANPMFVEQLARAGAPDDVHGVAISRLLHRAGLAAGLIELLRRVSGDRVARTSIEFQLTTRRHWEVTVSYVDRKGGAALLLMGRDVTEREAQSRRLQDASSRLSTLTGFARASLSFDSDRLIDGVVEAAAAVCSGPAAMYLGKAGTPLRRAAIRGCAREGGPELPQIIPAARFALLRTALASGGTTRVVGYAPDVSSDERLLLRGLGMLWLTAVPVRGQLGVIGLLVTLWRAPARGPLPEQLQVLEACAGQLALAFEHARLYQQVETERASLALVLDQIPDAVVIADEHGHIAHANPAAERLMDGGGATNGDASAVDARTTTADLGLERALGGETVRGAVGVVRTDGAEPAWILSSAAPLRTREGRLTGAVAVATDITRQRLAQDALRVLAEISAALAGSLDYRGTLPVVARLLVPRLADVCAIDVWENGAPTRVAVACAEPIAVEMVQALERHSLAADASPEDPSVDQSVIEDVNDRDLESLTRDPEHLRLLRMLALRSSMRVPISARGRTFGILWLATAHSGRRYADDSRALAEDVAWRLGAAIDNAQLFREAQVADHRKDEFLAMLSHELRTPLAPIMAWVQILKRSADPERVKAAAEVIERSVRLQAALIDDLLDLTAVARGKMRLEIGKHDLRSIVETALETVRTRLAEKQLVLACELDEQPLMVEGDAHRLQQVVWNLLSNAVKFSPAGERIRIWVAAEDGCGVVRVRDRGAGIEPEFLPYVFDMFRQQEHGDRRFFSGLGIGLAIARRVTELHRGSIEVHSDGVGKGAEFCVRLPLVAGASAERHATAPWGSLEGRSVLLVEDVPDTREATHLMLEQLGVRVVAAAEGEEALVKLEESAVDLVLCDLRMPLMDGFELIRRIRNDPRHHVLPVIAVSGYATEDDERRTREAGFDGYVRKPFAESTLVAVVARALRERERVTSA